MVGIALVKHHYEDPFLDDDSRPKWLPGDRWKVRQGIIPRKDAVEYDSEEGAALLARI